MPQVPSQRPAALQALCSPKRSKSDGKTCSCSRCQSAAEAARVESDRIAAEAAAAEPAHANVSNYTATEGLQKLEQAEMAVTAQKARHGGDEAAGAKALYQQSKLKVDEKLEQFKEREHIEVAPVYLGDIHRPEYANLKQTITTGKMQRMIEKEFYTMLERTFKHHPLKEYFEPRSDGKQGYQPKTVSLGLAGNRKERMFDIDHVVPDNWGGINHPRNMVVMHRSMNRSFQDALPETKWYYLSHRKSGVLRHVALFVKEVLGSKAVKKAIESAIQELKDL